MSARQAAKRSRPEIEPEIVDEGEDLDLTAEERAELLTRIAETEKLEREGAFIPARELIERIRRAG